MCQTVTLVETFATLFCPFQKPHLTQTENSSINILTASTQENNRDQVAVFLFKELIKSPGYSVFNELLCIYLHFLIITKSYLLAFLEFMTQPLTQFELFL